MPFVSILTPVFNGATYLRPCLDSVLHQTYQDWEYVIVDNCSTDETADILREYAGQDSRIRIVTNRSFVGIIENHNIAFAQVNPKADYCKMVQADDWIYPSCVEKFVRFCDQNPSVSLATAYRLDGDSVGLKGLPESQSVFSGRDIVRAFFFDERRDIFGSPTSYFLRAKSVLTSPPFFNPQNIYADVEACIRVLTEGDFGFLHEVLTFTRRPADAQTPLSHYLRVTYPSYLWIMKNYGPAFLTPEEIRVLMRRHLRAYYQMMARDLVNLRRNLAYWRFHIRSLREVGHSFNPLRLLAAMPQLPGQKWLGGRNSPPANPSGTEF